MYRIVIILRTSQERRVAVWRHPGFLAVPLLRRPWRRPRPHLTPDHEHGESPERK